MEFLVCSLLEGCEGKDARIVHQNVERAEGSLLTLQTVGGYRRSSRSQRGWLRPCRRNFLISGDQGIRCFPRLVA